MMDPSLQVWIARGDTLHTEYFFWGAVAAALKGTFQVKPSFKTNGHTSFMADKGLVHKSYHAHDNLVV